MAEGPFNLQRCEATNDFNLKSILPNEIAGRTGAGEITRVRQLSGIAVGPVPLLFRLDEPFHGTNSHDRVIGSAGVLRSLLDRGAIGLITTHDLAVTAVGGVARAACRQRTRRRLARWRRDQIRLPNEARPRHAEQRPRADARGGPGRRIRLDAVT